MSGSRGKQNQQRTRFSTRQDTRLNSSQQLPHFDSQVEAGNFVLDDRQVNENRPNIERILLDIKDEIRSSKFDLMEQIDELKSNVRDLNSKLDEKDKIIHTQQKQLNNLETELHSLLQYNRRECLEIAGIPETIEGTELEKTVIKIFSKIDVNVEEDQIHGCHRLPKKQGSKFPKRTIIRFVNRKTAEKIKRNKKKLREEETVNNWDLNIDIKGVYINENLCKPYKDIWSMVRQLHKAKFIHSFWTYNGVVNFREQANDVKPHKITHVNELYDIFHDFNFER